MVFFILCDLIIENKNNFIMKYILLYLLPFCMFAQGTQKDTLFRGRVNPHKNISKDNFQLSNSKALLYVCAFSHNQSLDSISVLGFSKGTRVHQMVHIPELAKIKPIEINLHPFVDTLMHAQLLPGFCAKNGGTILLSILGREGFIFESIDIFQENGVFFARQKNSNRDEKIDFIDIFLGIRFSLKPFFTKKYEVYTKT